MRSTLSLKRFVPPDGWLAAVAGAVLASLLAAALALIELALQGLIVAGVLLAVRGIIAFYRWLPLRDREQLLSRASLCRTGLASIVLAIVTSCLYWFAPWLHVQDIPSELVQSFLARYWQTLDFVPSAFSLLLPSEWQSGVHLYFQSGTYCFPGPFWWESMRYLRTAIPAYTLAFFIGITAVRFIRLLARATLSRHASP